MKKCIECGKRATLMCEEQFHYFCDEHGSEDDECRYCEPILLIPIEEET